MKKKRIFYFVLFVIMLLGSFYFCDQYDYHRYDANNQIHFVEIFIFQGLLMYFAINTFFVNINDRIKMLLINSAIVFVCCVFMFQIELLRSATEDMAINFLLKIFFDPYLLLLHLAYAGIWFIIFKFAIKWRYSAKTV